MKRMICLALALALAACAAPAPQSGTEAPAPATAETAALTVGQLYTLPDRKSVSDLNILKFCPLRKWRKHSDLS